MKTKRAKIQPNVNGGEIMDIFGALTMVGGLCLFLFGMSLMGQALEKRAGGGLRTALENDHRKAGGIFNRLRSDLGNTKLVGHNGYGRRFC